MRVLRLALLVIGVVATPALGHHGADTETTGSVVWSVLAFAGLALLVGAIVAVVVRLLTQPR